MNSNFAFLFDNPYNIHYEYDNSGVAWFYASEIAKNLGYPRAYDMLRMCAPNEIKVLPINNPVVPEIGLDMSGYATIVNADRAFSIDDSDDASINETPMNGASNRGGARRFTIVNEYGIYRIAMNAKSERPEIEAFSNWVIYVLIPSVKRHDAYIGPEAAARIRVDPTYINEIIAENEALKHQAALQPLYHVIDKSRFPYGDYEQMKQIQEQNKQFINTGKAVYRGEECISINQLSKIISQSINYKIGENSLKGILRDYGYLMKRANNYNQATQLAISNGYMAYRYIENEDRYELLVTPIGINHFINMLIEKGYGPAEDDE